MPQVILWNPWFEGDVLSFELMFPGLLGPVRTTKGPWLEAAAAEFGARPRGAARLRPARFWYSGDYADSVEWEDRWAPMTLVEVEVEPAGLPENPVFEDDPCAELWIEDDELCDCEADTDPAHDVTALLVFDFPAQVPLEEAWLASLAKRGELAIRTFNGPPYLSKLQPIRQVRLIVSTRFPAEVSNMEELLEEGRTRGASVQWRHTYHPRNE